MGTSDAIIEAIEQLLESDLNESALQLAELECKPQLNNAKLSIPERLQLLDALCKAQQGTGQHRQSLQTLSEFVSGPSRAQLSRTQLESLARSMANIRWHLKEYDMCLTQLRQIPAKHRTVRDFSRMARCAALVESPDAAELYEEVVKLQPNAVEAYAFLNAARGSVAVPTPYVAGGEAYGAVQGLAVARSLVARLAYAQAIDEIQRLVRRHGNVASLVALQATCHYMLNDGRRAQALYMKARKLDPSLMVEMGTYADLLRTTTTDDNEHKLYELGSALLQTDQTRAEGWTTMARYLLLRGQLQEALAISWKAQALAPGSADAFYIEGVIQMAAVCPEEAADAFLKAHMLARNALTYRGIVDAYLACARYKDAFVVAKEAAELMPAHAQTLTMVGKVLSHSADTHEKAAELLRMALREDRRCADAVDALASLYAATGRHDEAIAVMDEFLAENPSDALHAKLADILTLADQLPRAAENYAVALDINPGNERARVGLNRVDRLMNPDAQHLQDGGNGEEEDEIGEPIDEPLPPSDQDDEMMLAMMRGEQGSPLGHSFADSDIL